MPRLPSVAMLGDITNLFGSTPRQLCQDLLQELGRSTPCNGEKVLSQRGDLDASPFGKLEGSPLNSRLDASPISRLVNSPFGRLKGSSCDKASPGSSKLDASPLSRLVNSPFGKLEGSPLAKAGGSGGCVQRARPAQQEKDVTPAVTRQASNEVEDPAKVAMRKVAVLEAAVNAAKEALASEAMDSEWTSHLASFASKLIATGHAPSELLSILHFHSWSGSQFSGPPDRELLLSDLQRAAASASNAAMAAAAASAAAASATSAQRPKARARPGRRGGA